jgi:catechol 2,3-dioxygenase-like lactoylglutathione lyase family enzyme
VASAHDGASRRRGGACHAGAKAGEYVTRPTIASISPFFIVSDVDRTVAFYRDRLGFQATYREPFFAIIVRDGAQIFIKSENGIAPVPNSTRHRHLRWDTYVSVPEPDALAAEFAGRGASFSVALKDTSDGLRGFEITDPDGYVLFFGRPRPD